MMEYYVHMAKSVARIELSKTSGLMKIPLLRMALNDPQIKIFIRPNDSNWYYENVVPYSSCGFNPYSRKIYINQISSLSSWLKDGKKNDRKHNEGNFLVKEVLFLIHDYLHSWSTLLIQSLMPELKFGHGEINEKTIEDHVFCHLLTEAAATVGLDYWFLSTIYLSDFCDLGTPLSTLTVSYHENDLGEYQKFNPKFVVQDPRMFETIANFYCNGDFPGFSLSDMKESPKLHGWLKHELTYGETQRKYTREWFSYLSNGNVSYEQKKLNQPIMINKTWQKKLIQQIGTLLWDFVKDSKKIDFNTSQTDLSWRRISKEIPDFRFINLRTVDFQRQPVFDRLTESKKEYSFFYTQLLSSFSYMTFPKELSGLLSLLRENNKPKSLAALMKLSKSKKIKSKLSDPADLFFLA